MSNLVCTLEEQASSVGEIELADEQLGDIFGACDGHSQGDSHPKSNCVPSAPKTHVAVSESFCEHFKFSLKICIDIEDDEEDDEILKDCDW